MRIALSLSLSAQFGPTARVVDLDLSALDLSTTSNDATIRSALATMGLVHARAAATNATTSVQTSIATVVNGLGTGVRIGDHGYGRGLVVNREVVNKLTLARLFTGGSWVAGTGTRTAGRTSPAGDTDAVRFETTSAGQYGHYHNIGADAQVHIGSVWAKNNSGASPTYFNNRMRLAYDGATARNLTAKLPSTWIRRWDIGTPSAGWAFVAADSDFFDAHDIDADFAQVEIGRVAHEVAVATGASATVPGDRLYFSNFAAHQTAGRMMLSLRLLPIAPSADYVAGVHQLAKSEDGSVSVYVTMPTRVVSVVIGASTHNFAAALPPWAHMEPLEIFLEFGGTSVVTNGHARVGDNLIVSLGASGAPQGALPSSGYLDLLCDGTGSQFDCLLQSVATVRPDWCPDSAVVTTDYRPIAPGVTARVMPLGDSITEQAGGAWRNDFRTLALAASKTLDFVGSQTDTVPAADPQHQGHSGYDIASQTGMAPHVRTWLTENRPHVLTLHIGTNNASDDYATTDAQLAALLDSIADIVPNTHVVAAEIIPSTDAATDTWIQTYNTNLQATVDAAATAGMHIERVDCYDWLEASDILPDKTHPTANGNLRIAEVFNSRVTRLLDPAEEASTLMADIAALGLTIYGGYHAGTGVEQWTKGIIRDTLSGSDRHTAQSTRGLRPKLMPNKVNGRDSLVFTGDAGTPNLIMPDLTGLGLSSLEMWMVFRSTADADGRAWHHFGTSGSGNHHPYIDGNVYCDFGSNTRHASTSGKYGTVGGSFVRPTFATTRILRVTSKVNDWTWDIDNGLWGFAKTSNTFAVTASPTWGSNLASANAANGLSPFFLLCAPTTAGERTSLYTLLDAEYRA